MLNIVMLVKDRPRLTHQALWTLAKETDVDHNIVIVDDGSASETHEMLRMFAGTHKHTALLRNDSSLGITGQARNLGVYWSEQYFGRGDYLYLTDNDVCFLHGWASQMVSCFNREQEQGLRLLGGARHPYHLPNAQHEGWAETDTVAGYSQLMLWDTWDAVGPLEARAVGVCQGEDHVFCRRIVEEQGKLVGYTTPPVLVDCGLTNTGGQPAVGHEAKSRFSGIIYE